MEVTGTLPVKNESRDQYNAPVSTEKALAMAKIHAEQLEQAYPFGFKIRGVWYLFPNETTVLVASSDTEALEFATQHQIPGLIA